MQDRNKKSNKNNRKNRCGCDRDQAFYNDQLGENPEEGRMREEYEENRGRRGR